MALAKSSVRSGSSLSGLPVLLSVFLPLTVSAQSAPPDANPSPSRDPIVVTATLGPKTVGESLSSVTVIGQDRIRQEQPAELKDLLDAQPGLSVISNGGYGKQTSVFARGTGSESTILLVDGVRLKSATSGGAPWMYVPPQLIDRVEIVRGSRSVLYGADAVGGVVQVFTPRAGTGTDGWLEAGGGNLNTRQVGAGISTQQGANRLSLNGNHFTTDGSNVRAGGDDLGYRSTAGSASISHAFSRGGEARLVMLRNQGNTEFEGGNTDFVEQILGLSLQTHPDDHWTSHVQFSEARDRQDTESPAYGPSQFNTRTRTARWDNTLTAGTHELVIGLEHQTDQVDGSTAFDETSRTNTALFGQSFLNWGPTHLQLGLRADDNEAYGRQETGAVALGQDLDHQHRLRVSYRTSFRAPTFNDLYYPFENYGGFSYSGNPDLKPERAGAFEVGLRGEYRHGFWDLAAYQNDIENLIVIAYSGTTSQPTNVERARIRGLELSGGLAWADWSVEAGVSVIDPRDRDTDRRLARRTGKTARLDVDRALGSWNLGGSVRAEGYRYDDKANNNRLPGYATLDLHSVWHFAPHWRGALKLNNVLDRRYQAGIGLDSNTFAPFEYLAVGRTVFLSLRYDLK